MVDEANLKMEQEKIRLEAERKLKELQCPMCFEVPEQHEKYKLINCGHEVHTACTIRYFESEIGSKKFEI